MPMTPPDVDDTPLTHGQFYTEVASPEDPADDPRTNLPGLPADSIGVLPPGVHPMDPSQPWDGQSPIPDATAAPEDEGTDKSLSTGRPPFPTDNDLALPVYQRAAHDWT